MGNVAVENVRIPIGVVELEGALVVPEGARGLVLFAHGSGSSRHSRRNNFVAESLRKNNVGTLLFDLLTEEEDRIYANRFDIELITDRLMATREWVETQLPATDFKIGYFIFSKNQERWKKSPGWLENGSDGTWESSR